PRPPPGDVGGAGGRAEPADKGARRGPRAHEPLPAERRRLGRARLRRGRVEDDPHRRDGGRRAQSARRSPTAARAGAPASAEDGWKTTRTGETTLDVVKPCGRCTTTRVDQDRGEVAD